MHLLLCTQFIKCVAVLYQGKEGTRCSKRTAEIVLANNICYNYNNINILSIGGEHIFLPMLPYFIMCLYPKLVKNPKYTKTKKNKGIVPSYQDPRVLYVPIACGNCKQCRDQKSREWRIRLTWELKSETLTPRFVTFTFSDKSFLDFEKELGTTECNATASLAVRRFLERWRKETGKSVKHWLITELGHPAKEGGHISTERLHLHGILWTNKSEEFIQKRWKYGIIHIGEYVNERTINYIVKYVTKVDLDHKGYKSQILCTNGIGKAFLKSQDAQKNFFNGKDTNESLRLPNGQKVNLPTYYRNLIYNETEREQLWINKLNKEERFINGWRYDISTAEEEQLYLNALVEAQKMSEFLGYGNFSEEWKKKTYNTTLLNLRRMKKNKG